ncbi:hypothetical protein ACC705_02470 [Rhizobium ruizarguesonis]
MDGLTSLTVLSHCRLRDVSALLVCRALRRLTLNQVPTDLKMGSLLSHPVLERLKLSDSVALEEADFAEFVRAAGLAELTVTSPRSTEHWADLPPNIRFEHVG